MNKMRLLILACVLSLNFAFAQENSANNSNYPPLADRYLGQKPPGLTPQIFAPGIVSTEEYLESEVLFLPDMSELSFTRSDLEYKDPEFFVMEYKNQEWSRKSIDSAVIDSYKERFSPSLSEIKSHEVFRDIPIIGFSISSARTIYFYVLDFSDGSGHMSYSRLVNGKYEKPIKMSKAINTGKYIAHPFIAPDESYLMWDAEKDGESTPDIYISFRQPDGSWGAAINMGDKINTARYEQRPKVTPDGKYLFFWKGDVKVRDGSTYVEGGPNWVDAKVIEELRPKSTSYPIAYSSKDGNSREIFLTDIEGKSRIKITDFEGSDGYPDWSPNGKRIAFYAKYDKGKTWSVHTMNSDGTNRKRLTQAKNKWDSSPTWSPDGKKIAFAREYLDSAGDWQEEIWIMNADGSEQVQLKTLIGRAPCFMQDGRILFHSKTETGEICIANSDGSNIITLTNNTAKDIQPKISPDGKQIAFISDRDGNQEVYVMNIDGSNQKRLTYNAVPDWDICWSPDGSKLLFASDTGEDLDLYMMNKDGSSLKEFIVNGSQPSWFNTTKYNSN